MFPTRKLANERRYIMIFDLLINFNLTLICGLHKVVVIYHSINNNSKLILPQIVPS